MSAAAGVVCPTDKLAIGNKGTAEKREFPVGRFTLRNANQGFFVVMAPSSLFGPGTKQRHKGAAKGPWRSSGIELILYAASLSSSVSHRSFVPRGRGRPLLLLLPLGLLHARSHSFACKAAAAAAAVIDYGVWRLLHLYSDTDGAAPKYGNIAAYVMHGLFPGWPRSLPSHTT